MCRILHRQFDSVQGLLQLANSVGYAGGPVVAGALQEVCYHQATVKLEILASY